MQWAEKGVTAKFYKISSRNPTFLSSQISNFVVEEICILTNTWQSESSGNDNCTRDLITRNYARFFNTKTTNSVSIISIERRYTKLLQI